MTSNIFQTNTFVSGMNTDTDVNLLPSSQYRYAENIRIITNDDGNTGVLQNIQDTIEIEGDIFERENEKILSVITVDKYIIALTAFPFEGKIINSVYRISNYNNPPLTKIVVVSGELGYTENSSIKLVANYESDTNIKLYMADGEHYIRVISLMDDRYVYNPNIDNPLLDSNGFVINPNFLDIITNLILVSPTIKDLGTGSLKTGMVQYAYQLFNARGNNSLVSPLTNLVHLTTSNTTSDSNDYEGNGKGTNSNKSVILNINLSYDNVTYNYLYDYIRIYRIHYSDRTKLPTIEVSGEIKIPTNVDSIQYEDTGTSILDTITIEEFNAITNSTFVPATIEKKDNRLFAANIVSNIWNPEYDARAYRCTKEGKIILQDSIFSRNISQLLPTDENELKAFYESIPEDHDCINPYNSVKGQPNEDNDLQYSNVIIDQATSKRALGGSGLNVSYTFVYTELELDKMGSIYSGVVGDDETKINVESYNSIGTVVKAISLLDDNSTVTFNNIGDVGNSLINNYADPIIDATYKGYQRDEIYRFGIVLYNSKNEASPVHWIADIRMPHAKEFPAFYAAQYLYGRALGVHFEVKNLPEDVVSYEIVRCERTVNDRTVLMQSTLSQITSYPYKYIDAGDQLATNQDCRPCIPLRYCFNSLDVTNIIHLKQSTKVDLFKVDTGTMARGVEQEGSYVEMIKDYYGVLISPELDINGNSALNYMKSCYIDQLYFLHSERAINTTPLQASDTLYTPQFGSFIYANQTVETYTTIRMNQDYLTGVACSTNGSSTSIPEMILEHVNRQDRSFPSLIAKRYIPFHANDFDYDEDAQIKGYKRITIDIENNAIFPQVLEQNAIANKSAYYQSIGDITYLNLAHVRNDRESYNSYIDKACYFGYCAVIQTNDSIYDVLSDHVTLQKDYVIANDTLKNNIHYTNGALWDIPVVNIKRNIIPYGGNTYLSRINSIYISTGYNSISDNNTIKGITYGGDTYIGILDHRTGSPWPNPEIGGGNPDRLQMSMTDFIPFETSINLNLQYGETTSRSCEGKRTYNDVYLSNTITGGTIGNYHIQSKPYYAYNDAYSSQSTAKNFVPKGLYSKDSSINNNRIMYSELKTNDEITDSFTQFKVANYLDVDSQYGKITNLKSFNNYLYFWQDSSLGIAAVNERSLIQDNNLGGLTLGTGDVLSRYDYATTGNGSSIINDPSIINTPSAMYWYDKDKNEICQLANGVNKISKDNTVQTWLNIIPRNVHDSLYDIKFNEVQMCFENEVLVYNERTRSFTSIYTFNPDKHASFSDKLLYIKNNKFKENADFALSKMQCKIQFIVNDNPNITKTFDNVYFGGVFTDIWNMITDIKFTTKHQVGSALKNLDDQYAIDYREDTYRFAIGRAEGTENEYSYASRLKGKYLICDYTINCDGNKDFNLLNVNTTYRQSLV